MLCLKAKASKLVSWTFISRAYALVNPCETFRFLLMPLRASLLVNIINFEIRLITRVDNSDDMFRICSVQEEVTRF